MDPELLESGRKVAMAGVAAWASKDLIAKILGPTADYLGEEIAQFAEKCNINVGRIFTNAARKLGAALDSAGSVNPRVLKGVLDDGAYADDEVAAEYFGGVLAAARSENSRDDRAVSILATIKSLSTYELRLHYIVYQSIHHVFNDLGGNLRDRDETPNLTIFIPRKSLQAAMDVVNIGEYESVMLHSLIGLRKTSLLSSGAFGKSYVKKDYPELPGDGFVAEPSTFGAQMYLWAHGRRDLNINAILGGAVLPDFPDVRLPSGVVRARPLKA